MSKISRLALGTAQFGFPYGFNRGNGAITAAEAGRILAMAWDHGLDMLDTATEYGEAEIAIGNAKPAHAKFRIVSKTPRIGLDRVSKSNLEAVATRAQQSVQKLRVECLDSLLVHHAPDLLSQGGDEIFRLLQRLKQQGITKRLGVSVYDPDTLNRVAERYPIEVVQLPLNVFDQRFAHGVLDMLAQRKIEVHVRSVFLQGVLLTAPDRLPTHLRKADGYLTAFHSDSTAAGVSAAVAALHYAAMQPTVSRIVFGVQSAAELRENIEIFASTPPSLRLNFQNYRVDDPAIIDPRSWPA